MTPPRVQTTNAALAAPAVAQPIVAAAATALAAIQAANVALDPAERTFVQNIPPNVWTDMKAAILGAYQHGKIPELQPIVTGAQYAVTSATSDGKVLITLTGPV